MSEFWKRKMRTYFTMFDLDKDGVISKDDWVGMSVPKVKDAKKELEDQMATQFANVWEQFKRGNETSDKNTMTEETFTKIMEKLRYDPELSKHLMIMLEGIFDITDLNGDGYLQYDEYERMFCQCGVKDSSFVKAAFESIDLNGDGKLSIGELNHAFLDFMYSDDEKSPYINYLGPLVD